MADIYSVTNETGDQIFVSSIDEFMAMYVKI